MAVDDSGWTPMLADGSVKALVEDASQRGACYDGNWRVAGDTLYVDARTGGGAWLGLGNGEIPDFAFRTRMAAPDLGGNASIFFRQHNGGQLHYQLDLKCERQAIIITRTDNIAGTSTVLSEAGLGLEPGREYGLELDVRGQAITTRVDGRLLNQVHDPDYPTGFVCLTAWNAHTHYVDPQLRIG